MSLPEQRPTHKPLENLYAPTRFGGSQIQAASARIVNNWVITITKSTTCQLMTESGILWTRNCGTTLRMTWRPRSRFTNCEPCKFWWMNNEISRAITNRYTIQRKSEIQYSISLFQSILRHKWDESGCGYWEPSQQLNKSYHLLLWIQFHKYGCDDEGTQIVTVVEFHRRQQTSLGRNPQQMFQVQNPIERCLNLFGIELTLRKRCNLLDTLRKSQQRYQMMNRNKQLLHNFRHNHKFLSPIWYCAEDMVLLCRNLCYERVTTCRKSIVHIEKSPWITNYDTKSKIVFSNLNRTKCTRLALFTGSLNIPHIIPS